MKKLLFAVLFLCTALSANAQEAKKVIKLSEPVYVTKTYEVYGEKVADLDKPRSLSSLAKYSEPQNVVVKTSIAEVCEKKGCFFVVQDGDMTARITFKDYGFFIPTDSQGKEVTIVGVFSKKMLSEEQAKHYAEDAGKNSEDIKGEQAEYSIVASSIILSKRK